MAATEQNGAIGVVATIQQDHRQIEQMLTLVDQVSGPARQEAFEDLVRKLAVHETAEEIVVHPLLKDIGAESVAQEVLDEEDTAKKALSSLDGMSVTSPEFEEKFRTIKANVLRHAQHEERDEHPRLMESEPREKLEKLAGVFEMAEKTAPTRPHAAAPEGRAGNIVLGPILGVTDRVRDALRDAMK